MKEAAKRIKVALRRDWRVPDARDLQRDENLPDVVLRKVIPGYARLAVEAAAHGVFFRKQLSGGSNRHEVAALG